MDEKKTIYNWGRHNLTRVEIYSEDERRSPIPTEGSFAKIHGKVQKDKKRCRRTRK